MKQLLLTVLTIGANGNNVIGCHDILTCRTAHRDVFRPSDVINERAKANGYIAVASGIGWSWSGNAREMLLQRNQSDFCLFELARDYRSIFEAAPAK
jgi:hypothetical protein